jgi:4-alpha-glucanotransferase
VIKLHFYLRFNTRFGQSLFITGPADELGNGKPAAALPMNYLSDELWEASFEIKRKELKNGLAYKYFLRTENGDIVMEGAFDRMVNETGKEIDEVQVTDTWNHAGEYENCFFSAPFKNVLLKNNGAGAKQAEKIKADEASHIFRVKAPLLQKDEVVCLLGNDDGLGAWVEADAVLLHRNGDWWEAKTMLKSAGSPVSYKYAVYNKKQKQLVRYEDGNNRLLHTDAGKNKLTILHDGFIHLPNDTWKGAGVAIPVFSLRSNKGFGTGEFADIKLLVDWAKTTGLKLVQLLPVNDTVAAFSWLDSYPYSAVSAFALHPLYINLSKVAGREHVRIITPLKKVQQELNAKEAVDYEEVMKHKTEALQKLYEVMGGGCLSSDDYKLFYKKNKYWLEPYAAFSYLRDTYQTSDFSAWPEHAVYKKETVKKLFATGTDTQSKISFYFFVQYHLHLQLKEAADYAHKKGIVIKGDIPIGISRNSCDAWVAPSLYNMDWQAGAPPDDFTAAGQNWGFPTYNWQQMQADGFAWWKQRFEQMSEYFDAFRIDHILGFFRIWSIPAHAVQGIMGRFVPCLPVHVNEFGENGMWFDYDRFCKPFITDEVLAEICGRHSETIKENYIVSNTTGGYDMLADFATQKQVEKYFEGLEETKENEEVKNCLYNLIANVLFFEEAGSYRQQFHFRIDMEKTASFRHLIPHVQERLKALYVNYFYRRQDDFWYKEAMHKLPMLKAATNMLVCGEDLGMVPHCVPDVMQQLGILSLEIQRMPKNPQTTFFHPATAPYMSVITPATHDMSTLRGWWEENRERTQQFYNDIMGQWGEAPAYCESWISRAIILQHLYSPAMWSIFQIQDLLGMSDTLRRENPQSERINNPANPKHYWQYRMHIGLEDLAGQKEFNDELKGYVESSGR